MKYLKTYENLSYYPYSAKIGDILICVKLPTIINPFVIGEKYKIEKIKIDKDNRMWFDILIKNNAIAKGWNPNFFLPELKYNMKKYNL